MQMWFSPKWSYEDPYFSRVNYICQNKYSDPVTDPPTRTMQIWTDVGDLSAESTTKTYSSTYSGSQVLDVDTLDNLSETINATA